MKTSPATTMANVMMMPTFIANSSFVVSRTIPLPRPQPSGETPIAPRINRKCGKIGTSDRRRLQDALLGHDWLLTLTNWVYIWGHWPVIITAAVVLYRTRPDRYLLLRNAIFLSGAIGFLFFALLPVAPPRLADPSLIDTVTLHSDSYRALQPPGLTNQYAAFPSLHFGWNLLVGFAVWGATRNVVLRTLSILGPAAMAAAVVVTANHYVIDPVAGMVVVLFALWVCRVRLNCSTSIDPARADRR